MKQTEGQLKLACENYLQYLMNQNLLYWDRLNSGNIITKRGKYTFRVRLCREGTADLFVLIKGDRGHPVVIFIELKEPKGQLRQSQLAFRDDVIKQGAYYYIVRSVEELGDRLVSLSSTPNLFTSIL